MVKTLEDYIPQIKKEFPYLSEKMIKKILDFGLKAYFHAKRFGCDILFKDQNNRKVTIFQGTLSLDPLKRYNVGLAKWRLKERYLYRAKKIEWDGYYYFGLTEGRYQEVKIQMENRRRKVYEFKNIFFYKVKAEIQHDHSIKHVFRIQYPIDCGFKFYNKNFRTRNFEYLGENIIYKWDNKKRTTRSEAV